jgi:hypothetical protein
MIDPEELAICKRRGHSPVIGEGWSPCGWCGLWLREKRTIEEREDAPPRDERDSTSRPSGQTEQETRLSPAELAIFRRRGHSTHIGKRWSKCSYCGFWLREIITREEREDEPPEDEMSRGTRTDREINRIHEHLKRSKELPEESRRFPASVRLLGRNKNIQEEHESMTVCKACGGEISFAHLEKHICPTPNADYEKERDRYREIDRERRALHERLGIAEVPRPPIWVYLEILLHDGGVLKYVTRRDDFSFTNNRLLIEPGTKDGWTERLFVNAIRSYRFREFANEADARAAAESGG